MLTLFIQRVYQLFLVCILLGLTSCSEPPYTWSLYNVAGHLPDLKFTLAAAGGQTCNSDTLKGKTVLLLFGYASCPDICPTTLAQLNEVLKKLGSQADQIRIVFISVDPHRDTPDDLQAYVHAFNSNAIGLTGTESQIADLARRYRVAYQIEKPMAGQDAQNYEVMHSRGVYIFDNRGRARLLAADTDSSEIIVKDLNQLLATTAL